MFFKGKKMVGLGLLALAALALPIAARAAESYEEYVEEAFTTDVAYTGKTYYHRSELADRELFNGIDVSWWQGVGGRNSTESGIDWKKMHDAGIDFVMVRVASRDTADGSIYEDTCADSHIRGALKNNINVGLYIFSQALTEAEAAEEAGYVLGLMYAYGWDVTLPIVIDRENGSYKRMTAGKLSPEEETNVCLAFANVIREAGYTPMVYANATWFCKYYDLDRLAENGCKLWLARWNERSDQPVDKLTYDDIANIDYDIWQYSDSGRILGSADRLDLDFWYMDTNIRTEELKMTANTANSVSLSWKPIADAKNYRVYRYDEDMEKYILVQNTTETEYVDTGLDAGETYRYRVRCCWRIGGVNYYGKYSKVLAAVTLPDKVRDVTVETRTASSVGLSWTEVYGADGYRVYQYSPDADKYVKIMDIDDGSAGCEIAGLAPAREYSFRIKAFRRVDGNIYWGKQSDNCDTVTKPSKVKNVKLTTKASAITLMWDKTARASGYRIFRLDESTGEYVKIATVKGNQTFSYKDTDLRKGTSYTYKVRAYKSYHGTNYCGGYSNAVTLKAK